LFSISVSTPQGQTSTHHTILLFILCLYTLSRKFSDLADRDKGGTKSHRDDRPEKETSSIEANDNVDLLIGRKSDGMRSDMVDEVGNQSLEYNRVPKKGKDIQENDALYAVRIGVK